jgi:hypothetical protein
MRMTMTDVDMLGPRPVPDRPPILVFPPLIPLTTLAASLLLQWLAPLGGIAQLGLALQLSFFEMGALSDRLVSSTPE